jgi:hypothetical protein
MRRFRDSVDQGVSTLLTLWPDDEGYLSLVNTEFSQVYPQAFAPVFEASDDLPYQVIVQEGNPPVLTPFLPVGVERFPGQKTRPIHAKLGSTVWAMAKKGGVFGSAEDEFIISWEYGDNGAENWVIGVDVDEQWFSPGDGNEYGGDIILNMLYYSVGKPLPPNIELIHNLRHSFFTYNIEKKLLFSVIEFVDRFGASTTKLEREIGEADEGKWVAERAYMEGDYEAAYDQIKAMIEQLDGLNQEAIKIKERALVWVYITEWSVVSGTLVLAGFVLYSLMVRRSLYRQVEVTRTSM